MDYMRGLRRKGHTISNFTADYSGKAARFFCPQVASLWVALAILWLVPSISAAAAADGFGAHAYGTEVRAAGPTLNSATTALCGICTFETGVSNTRSITGVTVGSVLTTGVITTTAASIPVAGGGEAKATAQVET